MTPLTWMHRLAAAAILVASPTLAPACTMPAPPPPEQPEVEIEIEFEDYNSADDMAYYKVEIEVGVVPPTAETICQCGLNLGSQNSTAPASFMVSNAVVGIKGDGYAELDDFAGFERDSNVEDYLGTLSNFNQGGTAFGFSVPVLPFDYPTLGPEDRLTLAFQIAFDKDDFDQVSGNVIQFAAGSNDPGHEINIFSGYQAVLSLPVITYSPQGDFNLDGEVNLADYTLWRDNLGATDRPDLDADDSGEVDERDYRIWRDNFGQVAFGASQAVRVPEPAAVMIAALACCAGLAVANRR